MSGKECGNTSCGRSSCEGCPSKNGGAIPKEELNAYSKINKVIGIVSGKGGVGKSTVTTILARKLAAEGYKVGIMDADITGPSIPRMLGVSGQIYAVEEGMMPLTSEEGIKVMSMNLLLEEEDAPVVFRGPVIAGVVKQFWNEVYWGELDYLLIDMPPGTGDVPLTVFQSLPVDGIVIVTSPQQLVEMIVMKAYHMAEKMNIPVLGFVENYSYFQCPDCGGIHRIYGESGLEELAAKLDTSIIATLPIMPQLAGGADLGTAVDLRGIQFDMKSIVNQ